MAVSFRQYTNTLLNAWAARTGTSIWQFNQITGLGTDAAVSEPGEEVFIQPEREFIADAIAQAYKMIVKECRFRHRPTYVSETRQIRSMAELRGLRWPLESAYVDAIGRRGATVISAGATVVYSDVNGGGVDDTATITVATSVTDPAEVQVFFKTSDSRAAAADERWQIEPLQVSIAGGVATITGHRALFVNPALWRDPTRSPNYNNASKNDGDTQDVADFVTQADVYRIYPDTTNAVVFNANPFASNPTSSPAGPETFAGDAVIANGTLGLVWTRVQYGISVTSCPASVTIHYRAGYPLDNFSLLPDRALEAAIIRLTNSLLPDRVPSTEAQTRTWEHDDAKLTEAFLASSRFNNPFGTKQGAVAAWDIVKEIQISQPVEAV